MRWLMTLPFLLVGFGPKRRAYARAKLSVNAVVGLLVPPILWGLLAFNNVLKPNPEPFTSKDVPDAELAASRLLASRDPMFEFIRDRSREQDLELLKDSSASAALLTEAIVRSLEGIRTNGTSIFDPERFRKVTLSAATQRLLESAPRGAGDIARLNRMLLEDAGLAAPAEKPIVHSSHSVPAIRFLGAGVLALVVAVGVLARLLRHFETEKPLVHRCGRIISGFFTYLRYNGPTMVMAAVFGCLLALGSFYHAFETVGVVVTNVVAVGCVPLCGYLLQAWARWLPYHWSGGKWIQAGTGEYYFDLRRHFTLVVLAGMIVLFLMFARGAIEPGRLADRVAPETVPFRVMGLWPCISYGLFWSLFLLATSKWPLGGSRVVSARDFSLEQHCNGGSVSASRKVSRCFAWLELLVFKLAGVQFLGAILVLSGALAFRQLPDPPEWSRQMVPDVLNAVTSFRPLRTWVMCGIIVFPSFLAYLLLNVATRNYDSEAKRNGVVVSANTWNGLLSFLEPLVACLVGVYVLGGTIFAGRGFDDRSLFEYPGTAILVACLAYYVVFAVELHGLYTDRISRDIGRYQRFLDKILRYYRERTVLGAGVLAARLKEQDKRLLQLRDADGLSLEHFVRDRTLLLLTAPPAWPFNPRYTTGRDGAAECETLRSTLSPVDESSRLGRKVLTLAAANFPSSRGSLLTDFDAYFLFFPEFMSLLPADRTDWRDSEKCWYLSLTGDSWFGLASQSDWTLGDCAGLAGFDEFEREFSSRTRGFWSVSLVGPSGDWSRTAAVLANPAYRRRKWRDDVLFPISPHLRDFNHLHRGRRTELNGLLLPDHRGLQVSGNDKCLVLLVPKSRSCTIGDCEIRFRNPYWPDSPLGQSAEFARAVHERMMSAVNGVSDREVRRRFARELPADRFILEHDAEL